MKIIQLLAALHIKPEVTISTIEKRNKKTGEIEHDENGEVIFDYVQVRSLTPGKCEHTGEVSLKLPTFHVNRKGSTQIHVIRAESRSKAARVWYRDHGSDFCDSMPVNVAAARDKM